MGHPADFPPSFSLRIALTYPFSHASREQRRKEKLIIVTSSFYTNVSILLKKPHLASQSLLVLLFLFFRGEFNADSRDKRNPSPITSIRPFTF